MIIIKDNNISKLSKRELLEVMIMQKTEIQTLEQQIELLQQENEALKDELAKKDKRLEEILSLAKVTNKLIQVTNALDRDLNVVRTYKKRSVENRYNIVQRSEISKESETDKSSEIIE